jgi:hypothetical protein
MRRVGPKPDLPRQKAPADPARLRARAGRALRRFLRRPDAPRWIAGALLLAVFVVRPGFIVLLALFTLFVAGIAYLTLGPDRVSEIVAARFERLKARDPARAEALRRRAARVSRGAARLADRLPAHWTTGLAIPDFEPAGETPEKLRDDPFARLARDVRGDATGR